MERQTSYDVSSFATNAGIEITRLNAQVDLFWPAEGEHLAGLGLSDGMSILDCGCGPGRLLELLQKRFPSSRCRGVEIDPLLVTTANDRMASLGLSCPVSQGSAEEPKIDGEKFDFIVMRLVLEHVPDPLAAITSLGALLKPGGRLAVISNDFEFHLRTYPPVPELETLYKAYCRARRADGGDPCIGRRVPSLFKQSGLRLVASESEMAHNAMIGDTPFLKAEGSGIPAQLVNQGYLDASVLEAMTHNWLTMLETANHSIARILWIAVAERPENWDAKIGGSEGVNATSSASQNSQGSLAKSVTTLDDKALLGIIAAELELDAVTVTDSLQELGIDSIGAIMVQQGLKAATGIELPVVQFLKDQPVSSLIMQLRSTEQKTTHAQPISSSSGNAGLQWDEGEL